MSMTVDEIVAEVRQLPREARVELLDRLGQEMHGEASSEIEAAWTKLALERLAAVEEGRMAVHPADEVMARMRRLIGR